MINIMHPATDKPPTDPELLDALNRARQSVETMRRRREAAERKRDGAQPHGAQPPSAVSKLPHGAQSPSAVSIAPECRMAGHSVELRLAGLRTEMEAVIAAAIESPSEIDWKAIRFDCEHRAETLGLFDLSSDDRTHLAAAGIESIRDIIYGYCRGAAYVHSLEPSRARQDDEPDGP